MRTEIALFLVAVVVACDHEPPPGFATADASDDAVIDVGPLPPDAPYPCGLETCQPSQYCIVSCVQEPGCTVLLDDGGSADGGCPAGTEPLNTGTPEAGLCCTSISPPPFCTDSGWQGGGYVWLGEQNLGCGCPI